MGDFAWVAKERGSVDGRAPPRELVLPHVAERKRVDDLKSSIFDGRYKEQKWRMARSGVAGAVYVVEEFAKSKAAWGSGAHGKGFNMDTIESAIISTAVTPK